MASFDPASVKNKLLSRLLPEDFDLLRPAMTFVPLARREVLTQPGQRIDFAWFPESGLGSIVAVSPEGHSSEVGMFGWDGLAGTPLLLGTDCSPQRVLIQGDGAAWRISADQLREALNASRTLHHALLRYVQALSTQAAHTALSNATHGVEERLARWLLMSHDRSESDKLTITHDFLALMLAVRRPTVTTALHVLEGMNLIRNVRGLVLIRDRAGLEELAADAYGIPEQEYERLVGPLRKRVKATVPA